MSGTVLITRHPADCEELQRLVQGQGLTIRAYPVLRIEEVDDVSGWKRAAALVNDPGGRPWVAFASPRAPERTARLAGRHGAGAILQCPAAAVGETTAAAAADAGFHVELEGPGSGAGLGSMLADALAPETAVILACGKNRRPELTESLRSAGHRVQPLVVYSMAATPPRELPPLGPGLEAVVLTSPRAARLYLESVGGRPLPLQHWALGATTRDAAAALGIRCRIPPRPTIPSLAEELCRI